MERIKRCLMLLGLLLFLHGCATGQKSTESSRKNLQRGLEHERNGNFREAIGHYNRAASSGAHDVAYVYIANTYQRMGSYDRSEKYYHIALEKLPRHADLHHNLAYLYLVQGIHLKRAETLATRAIDLNEESDYVNRYRSTLKTIRTLRSNQRLGDSSSK